VELADRAAGRCVVRAFEAVERLRARIGVVAVAAREAVVGDFW